MIGLQNDSIKQILIHTSGCYILYHEIFDISRQIPLYYFTIFVRSLI